MVKNTPYLFGGALTISSIVAFSFIAPNIEKYFKSQNLKSHQNVVLSAFKKEIEKPEQEGKYLEYAAPLVGCEFSYNLNAAATYFISSLQGVDVACITNDRNNAIFPVGGLGVQPPEALAWGFKIQLDQKIEHGSWLAHTEYNFYKAITNSGPRLPYGQGFAPSAYANTQIDNIPFSNTIFNNLDMGTYTLLNNFRLYLCRPSLITPRLEFTTQFGFDANFLQRRQINVFTNAMTDSTTQGYISSLGGFFQNYQKITWWGVGPCVGFNTRWDLGSHFYFVMDGYGAITYGNSTSRTATFSKRVNVVTGNISYIAQEAAVQNLMNQFAPSMRYLIGINYCYLAQGEESQVNFQIAYETAYYFNLIRTINPEGAFRSENGAGYGIQGLVLQAGVTF
jgi:hypothetical protein